jgi:paraquat-inducible protein B
LSKKANPTVVGTFVLVALGLALATIVMLGDFKFRDERLHCVAFFPGSLHGLDVGSPVTFRGVNIGQVSAVRISFDSQEKNYFIPVHIDIAQTPDLADNGRADDGRKALRATLEQLIDQGLRAQLKVASLLTGKLYIDLALHPGSKARVQGRDPARLEFPTLPSGLEQITEKLERLPLSDVLDKVASALDGINSIMGSDEARESLRNLDTTLTSIASLAAHADAELPSLTVELRRSATTIASLAGTAEQLLHKTDRELPRMSHDLQQLFASFEQATSGITKAAANIEQMTTKDSDLTWQLSGSLAEVGKAAASIRRLSDYLQQYPNALLFGQGKEKQ